ncbi:hypothetical protein L1887_39340 [Cichorium endivia]|nr:hypothetical protein L1887_39340 [Cichorium endivia]
MKVRRHRICCNRQPPTPPEEAFTLQLTWMEKTVLTPEFIACMGVIFLLQSPGKIADIRMTNEILWFIIPAITSQCISMAVKTVRITAEPTTWKKLEDNAKKAMFVAYFCELIAVYQMGVLALSDCNWGRLLRNTKILGNLQSNLQVKPKTKNTLAITSTTQKSLRLRSRIIIVDRLEASATAVVAVEDGDKIFFTTESVVVGRGSGEG